MNLHADDVGINREVNQAVAKLLAENKLTSVSVLANFPLTIEACKLLRRHPKIPVFLHFNLVEGTPLTLSSKIASLTTSNGQLCNRNEFMRRILLGRIEAAHVKAELTAQINILKKNGLKISGIDSHQHMHALSPIAEIVTAVADEFNLPFIRSYSQMQNHSVIGGIKTNLFKFACFLSHMKTYSSVGLPCTWRLNKWKNFSVASWEPIKFKRISKTEILVYHPGSNYDKIKLIDNLRN